MFWNITQQKIISDFINEIKSIDWFSQVGNESSAYWVVDSIWEACDMYGEQMINVWGKNCEQIEKSALKFLKEDQIDDVFEQVSLAIGNELYAALCDLEDKIGQETGIDQSGIEEEILDFIKRDTAWACVERLIMKEGFFNKVYNLNKSGRWACSWIGVFPDGNFIIM